MSTTEKKSSTDNIKTIDGENKEKVDNTKKSKKKKSKTTDDINKEGGSDKKSSKIKRSKTEGNLNKSPEDKNKSPEDENKSPEDKNKSPDDENKSPDDENKSPDDENKSPDDENKSPEDNSDDITYPKHAKFITQLKRIQSKKPSDRSSDEENFLKTGITISENFKKLETLLQKIKKKKPKNDSPSKEKKNASGFNKQWEISNKTRQYLIENNVISSEKDTISATELINIITGFKDKENSKYSLNDDKIKPIFDTYLEELKNNSSGSVPKPSEKILDKDINSLTRAEVMSYTCALLKWGK